MCSRQPTAAEVDACRIDAWYPRFQAHTIATRFLDLPDDFVAYLLDGGSLFLPETADPTRETYAGAAADSDAEDEDTQPWEHDDGEDEKPLPSFPQLEADIATAIAELEGAVLPKLSWSAPLDAKWIARNGSLKCASPGEVFLLLKSSERTDFDLTAAYRDCADAGSGEKARPKLALRNWYEIEPAREYRCFVRNNRLIAVTQRNASVQTPLTGPDEVDLLHDVYYFFLDRIRGKFPARDFVMDVYVPRRERVYLIDFNPYGPQCDPILFSWEELEELTAQRASGASAGDEEPEEEEEERPGPPIATWGELEQQAAAAEGLPPTQTERLNKTLLEAFLRRVNDDPTVPRVEAVEDADADAAFAADDGEDPAAVAGAAGMVASLLGAGAAGAGAESGDDDEEEEDEAAGLDAVVLRLQRDPSDMRAPAFAAHAYPRDVVEIAGTGSVEAMIQAMQRAQAGGDEEDEEEEAAAEAEGAEAEDEGR